MGTHTSREKVVTVTFYPPGPTLASFATSRELELVTQCRDGRYFVHFDDLLYTFNKKIPCGGGATIVDALEDLIRKLSGADVTVHYSQLFSRRFVVPELSGVGHCSIDYDEEEVMQDTTATPERTAQDIAGDIMVLADDLRRMSTPVSAQEAECLLDIIHHAAAILRAYEGNANPVQRIPMISRTLQKLIDIEFKNPK